MDADSDIHTTLWIPRSEQACAAIAASNHVVPVVVIAKPELWWVGTVHVSQRIRESFWKAFGYRRYRDIGQFWVPKKQEF